MDRNTRISVAGIFVAAALAASLYPADGYAGQATPNVGVSVKQVSHDFNSLAPKAAPLDLKGPAPGVVPPAPNVSAYAADLARISAYQRELAILQEKQKVTATALTVEKNLVSLQKAHAELEGKGKKGTSVVNGSVKTTQSAEMPTTPMKSGAIEVIDVGGGAGHVSATMYLRGVGPIDAHVGDKLPNGVQIASITENGVSVVLPDGSHHFIGVGHELKATSGSQG